MDDDYDVLMLEITEKLKKVCIEASSTNEESSKLLAELLIPVIGFLSLDRSESFESLSHTFRNILAMTSKICAGSFDLMIGEN